MELSVQLVSEIDVPFANNNGTVPSSHLTVQNHEMRLHELNTLEWDELVANDSNNASAPKGGRSRCYLSYIVV